MVLFTIVATQFWRGIGFRRAVNRKLAVDCYIGSLRRLFFYSII